MKPLMSAHAAENNLTVHRTMLDVGGGSAAHSIGALNEWPELRAIVFDRPAICKLAGEFAERYGLGDRISTQPGDFFVDEFPPADLVAGHEPNVADAREAADAIHQAMDQLRAVAGQDGAYVSESNC